MLVLNCIANEHNPWLVVIAGVICGVGIWITLRLLERAAQRQGRQRLGWIFLTAVAGGSSIWCTHFIGMLAYDAPAAIRFEPILTLMSLFAAIAGSAIGFQVAISRRIAPEVGGILVGVAIASMHYLGMRAYLVDGLLFWNWNYVALSWTFSLGLSGFALGQFVRNPHRYSRSAALALFALAVLALHFTGMASVTVIPGGPITATDPAILVAMAVAVAGGALVIVSTGIVSHLIDDAIVKENIEQLRYLALNDALTDLPNRAAFSDQFTRELRYAQRDGLKVAVVGLDLNRFKEINDLRGHLAGDQVLKIIGFRLGQLCRDGEFIARIGGDEFCAVKRFADQADLIDFLSRVECGVLQAIQIDAYEVTVGVSIGVAVYPDDGLDPQMLIHNADLAMYRAKSDVMRTICFYEQRMDEAARIRRNLSVDLREAIACNQLELHYQVQTSVVSGDTTGYEALLRWHHPVHGVVPPSDFIPVAEANGLIVDIGAWVLRTACMEAASWPLPCKIAVNISPVQFADANLAALVHQVLLETGLKAERLELEITESTIIANKELTLHTLRRIRALGVTIALDDFGTGYSSLDTLRSFPFDRIKLDRSFMKEAEHIPQATAIIRAVLALGKSLNVSILAEGVESGAQLNLLRREGCDEAQGFYLGRPKPVGEIPHHVAAPPSPATLQRAG